MNILYNEIVEIQKGQNKKNKKALCLSVFPPFSSYTFSFVHSVAQRPNLSKETLSLGFFQSFSWWGCPIQNPCYLSWNCSFLRFVNLDLCFHWKNLKTLLVLGLFLGFFFTCSNAIYHDFEHLFSVSFQHLLNWMVLW